jgi:hypothetical protein
MVLYGSGLIPFILDSRGNGLFSILECIDKLGWFSMDDFYTTVSVPAAIVGLNPILALKEGVGKLGFEEFNLCW